MKRVKEENDENQNSLSMIFMNNEEFTIEEIVYRQKNLYHQTFKIPKKEEISNYSQTYDIPNTLIPLGNHGNMEEWELGFKNFDVKTFKIYEDDQIQLFSINNKFIGIACNRKKRRKFRTILKNKSGESIIRGIDNLNYINNPDIKPGIFHINKVDCIFNKEDNIEKIFVYDSNKFTTYRWEINLNGYFIKSEKIEFQ